MDNFDINLTSEGDLTKAMEIAFRRDTAIGYSVGEKGLVFFKYDAKDIIGFTKLPFKLDAAGAADFAKRWLSEQDYGGEPDHDGDNGRGWCLYTEGWGMVGSWHQSIVAVKPAWAMYGK